MTNKSIVTSEYKKKIKILKNTTPPISLMTIQKLQMLNMIN